MRGMARTISCTAMSAASASKDLGWRSKKVAATILRVVTVNQLGLFNCGVTTRWQGEISIFQHQVGRFYVLISTRHLVANSQLNSPLVVRGEPTLYDSQISGSDPTLNRARSTCVWSGMGIPAGLGRYF